MTEPVTAPIPSPRGGPRTPEGKARSAQNARKHGLRARDFLLSPDEDTAEWALHLSICEEGYGPTTAHEKNLVCAIAAAMWNEIRADRAIAEVMARIPPPRPGDSHGTDSQEHAHALSLNTAIRYQTAAGMAVQRSQRTLFTYRNATLAGVIVPRPAPAEPANANCTNEPQHGTREPGTGEPGQPGAANQNCTNEPPPDTNEPDTPEPGTPEAEAASGLHEAAAGFAPGEAGRATTGSGLGLDDQAWLATLPVVEADPEREAKRRELLLQVEPVLLRRAVGKGDLSSIENLLLPDMAAYEEWFARQPKPEQVPAKSLGPEHAAMVEEVTRYNPPWFKGEYLSYWRKPVPKELLDQPGTMPECATPPPPPASITTPLAALRARIARLLDRKVPRRLDELELAEAVCAVRWPHWGLYRGPLDLELLRRALDGTEIDGRTLSWLDSHAFADQCRRGEDKPG